MVFHDVEYGEVVSVPMMVPLARNVTAVTPTLSVALADTVAVPERVDPPVGDVRDTVGGVVSEGWVWVVALTIDE